jgi:hypothetical protein
VELNNRRLSLLTIDDNSECAGLLEPFLAVKLRSVACTVDINRAAGIPLPATSAIARTKLAAVIEVDEVVIVAADTTRRLAETGDLHRQAFWRARRKQTLLHFGCESEFASHAFLRHHAFRQTRVVDDERELSGDRHQQLAIGGLSIESRRVVDQTKVFPRVRSSA